jgi:uncharacterized membrane protein YcaP (DUF421 family)
MAELLEFIFGGDKPASPISIWQIMARAVVVYVYGVVIIRCGKRRLLGRTTPIDFILGVMLGALFSGAIIGTTALSGAAAATIALISMHSISTWLACRSHRVGDMIKGQAKLLVENGDLQEANMHASHISEHDLREEMRINANINQLEEVEQAFLERSGEISVVKKRH